jgi:hypothetical protein
VNPIGGGGVLTLPPLPAALFKEFSPLFHLITSLPALLKRLDAVLGLLDSTADALAAEWGLRNHAVPDVDGKRRRLRACDSIGDRLWCW